MQLPVSKYDHDQKRTKMKVSLNGGSPESILV